MRVEWTIPTLFSHMRVEWTIPFLFSHMRVEWTIPSLPFGSSSLTSIQMPRLVRTRTRILTDLIIEYYDVVEGFVHSEAKELGKKHDIAGGSF